MLLALGMVAFVAAAEPEEALRIEVGRISVVRGPDAIVSFSVSDPAVARAERLGEHVVVVGVSVGTADLVVDFGPSRPAALYPVVVGPPQAVVEGARGRCRPGELAELLPVYEATAFVLADSDVLTATPAGDRHLVLCGAGWGTTDVAIQLPWRSDAVVLTYTVAEPDPLGRKVGLIGRRLTRWERRHRMPMTVGEVLRLPVPRNATVVTCSDLAEVVKVRRGRAVLRAVREGNTSVVAVPDREGAANGQVAVVKRISVVP